MKKVICSNCGEVFEVADKSCARFCEKCRYRLRQIRDLKPIYCKICGSEIGRDEKQKCLRNKICPSCYGPEKSPSDIYRERHIEDLKNELEKRGWPTYINVLDYISDDCVFKSYPHLNSRKIALNACITHLGYKKATRRSYKKI